ncbi:MAG: SecDF P1 head subdomain-containing protein [Stackebrandtia sp.]
MSGRFGGVRLAVVVGVVGLLGGCAQAGEVASPGVPPDVEPVQMQFRAVLETAPPDSSDGEAGQEESGQSEDVELEAVWDAVGTEAAELAQSLEAPVNPEDEETAEILAPFGELTPSEVAVLPAKVQFYVPSIGCGQLDARAEDDLDPDAEATACQSYEGPESAGDAQTAYVKNYLGPAELDASDVARADTAESQFSPDEHVVKIDFTDAGADKWKELASANLGEQVAIVAGVHVVFAPELLPGAESSQEVEITNSFTAEEAELLAAQINAAAGQ